MKTNIQALIGLVALFCGSCVPSVHPLYTDADLTFDPALIGVWTTPDSTETWEFSMEGEKEYEMINTDENGKKGKFEARLVKLEGEFFLDLCPKRQASTQNDLYAGHILSVHSFVKLTRNGSGYQISYIEPKWLKSLLEKEPTALRHTSIDGEVLITDLTPNLQKFVVSNGSSPGAFSAPVTMRRRYGKK